MIFLSGTFSPSAGIPVLKEFRYLFARFYLWCMIDGVKEDMDSCPDDDVIVLYSVLSGLIGFVLFLVYEGIRIGRKMSRKKKASEQLNTLKDDEFVDLQVELFGEQVLLKPSLSGSTHSRRSRSNSEDSVPKKAPTSSGPYATEDADLTEVNV
jgi:hypothetical protein